MRRVLEIIRQIGALYPRHEGRTDERAKPKIGLVATEARRESAAGLRITRHRAKRNQNERTPPFPGFLPVSALHPSGRIRETRLGQRGRWGTERYLELDHPSARRHPNFPLRSASGVYAANKCPRDTGKMLRDIFPTNPLSAGFRSRRAHGGFHGISVPSRRVRGKRRIFDIGDE